MFILHPPICIENQGKLGEKRAVPSFFFQVFTLLLPPPPPFHSCNLIIIVEKDGNRCAFKMCLFFCRWCVCMCARVYIFCYLPQNSFSSFVWSKFVWLNQVRIAINMEIITWYLSLASSYKPQINLYKKNGVNQKHPRRTNSIWIFLTANNIEYVICIEAQTSDFNLL